MTGRVKPASGKDPELFVLSLQPSVKLPDTVETQIIRIVDIPYGDFAIYEEDLQSVNSEETSPRPNATARCSGFVIGPTAGVE